MISYKKLSYVTIRIKFQLTLDSLKGVHQTFQFILYYFQFIYEHWLLFPCYRQRPKVIM